MDLEACKRKRDFLVVELFNHWYKFVALLAGSPAGDRRALGPVNLGRRDLAYEIQTSHANARYALVRLGRWLELPWTYPNIKTLVLCYRRKKSFMVNILIFLFSW